MPIELGGSKARFIKRKGDICASFQYVNGEPSMCLFPAIRKSREGAFVICESAAHQYVDERYLMKQAMAAAEVMGMDMTGQTVFRIADAILLWMDDLLMMPPEPAGLDGKQTAIGEIDVTANGVTHTHELMQ